MSRGIAILVVIAIQGLALPPLADAEWTIDREASVFAVVTHKEGLAAGLAHEHLVVADGYDFALRAGGLFSAADDPPGSAEIEVPAGRLQVDDPAMASAWQERLLELGLISEPFADLSEKDRRKIRKSMLGKKQLNAESHPDILASVTSVRPVGGDEAKPAYEGTLSLTVRGETSSREVEFEIDVDEDGRLRTEVAASFVFSDFGIEPYSAMLGAIRVADSFDVFVVLVATR